MTLAVSAIFQGWDQNILQGATISGTAPLTTYALATLGYLRPDWRVKWGTSTVTVTWTLSAPKQGDIFVLPMSNLSTGSATLTNGSGLSQAITVPTALRNGLPQTIVVDLTVGTPSTVTRTSNVWNLVVSANPVNLTLGGAVALYSPKTWLLDRDFQWAYKVGLKGAYAETANEYLSRFILNMQSMERSLSLRTFCTARDGDALQAAFTGCNGRGLPGLLWLDPGIEDGFLGLFEDTFTRTVGSELVPDTDIIELMFTELSKGIPIS